jgi:beta-glucanase (GH16 family)
MMRKIRYISILAVLLINPILLGCSDDNVVADPGDNDNNPLEGFKLLWSDEFDGETIDNSKWEHEVNGHGGGNNELQYYTDRPENSYLSDGKLHMVALQEEYTGSDGKRYYTSARMKTQNTKSFMYGRIEASLKLPYGQGLWPAFWMLGLNNSEVGWPACGEIDIMEMVGGGDGRDNRTYGTLHWDDNGKRSSGGNLTLGSGILHDEFRVYAIEWDEEKIDWYLDDELFFSLDLTDPAMSAFQAHHFLILNVAVGGNWPGNPDLSTVWPQEMVAEYVRVYERE